MSKRVVIGAEVVAAAKECAAQVMGVAVEDFGRADAAPHWSANRARYVAFAGLIEAFPGANHSQLARDLGVVNKPDALATRLRNQAMTARWWRDDYAAQVAARVRAAA